ncbi:MAG: dienelactone hydrolase family protein [Pyrinomonadaceae bacterium]
MANCNGSSTNGVSNSATPHSANTTDNANTVLNDRPQTVTIDSPDGVKLVGSFYGSPKAGSPAVLLLHQFNSDRHSYDDFAKRLQVKGFGVLSIDGRGFGESVKTADGKTVSVSRSDEAVKGMLADVNAAFEFLSRQKNVDTNRIGIVGASYGSSLAIIYGAENPKVKAVALLSPGLNYFGNMPTEPAVKKYGDRPLLMVAADDDAESAVSVKKLKEAGAKDKYEIKIYEKGGHGTGIFKAKVGLEDLLEQFLTKSS